MKINDMNFNCTCPACPEQYDVYDNGGKQIGYIRLRWGSLKCESPDVDGEMIYSASIGNKWTGKFETNEQRMYHLTAIAETLKRKENKHE